MAERYKLQQMKITNVVDAFDCEDNEYGGKIKHVVGWHVNAEVDGEAMSNVFIMYQWQTEYNGKQCKPKTAVFEGVTYNVEFIERGLLKGKDGSFITPRGVGVYRIIEENFLGNREDKMDAAISVEKQGYEWKDCVIAIEIIRGGGQQAAPEGDTFGGPAQDAAQEAVAGALGGSVASGGTKVTPSTSNVPQGFVGKLTNCFLWAKVISENTGLDYDEISKLQATAATLFINADRAGKDVPSPEAKKEAPPEAPHEAAGDFPPEQEEDDLPPF